MASKENGQEEASEQWPAIFEQVLDSELAYLRSRPPRKEYTAAECESEDRACDSDYAAEVVADAHKARLSGIAFSGGGIRSATFNLGVLQGLARLKLLTEFDYLSTVSGGGYIGSWLTAWIRHEDQSRRECGTPPATEEAETGDGLERVSGALAAAAGEDGSEKRHGAMQPDPLPLWHLREYSNYLTPRRGLLSTDTWSFIAASGRNLLLTLGVLLGVTTTLVLFAQAFASGFVQIAAQMPADGTSEFTWPYYVFVAFMSVASMLLGIELSPRRAASARHSYLAYVAVILSLAAAATGALWLSTTSCLRNFDDALTAVVPFMFVVMAFGFTGRWFGNHGLFGDAVPSDEAAEKRAMPWLLAGGVLSLLTLIVLWWWAAPWMSGWASGNSPSRELLVVVLGVPLVVLMFSVSATVSVGFAGPALKELEREWLGRFFGALTKWAILYAVLMALVVYSFHLVESLPQFIPADQDSGLGKYVKPGLGSVWAVVSAAGAFLGRRPASAQAGWTRWLRHGIVAVAPAVFILGLLILTIWGTTHAVHGLVTALSPYSAVSTRVAEWTSTFPFLGDIPDKEFVPEAGNLITTGGFWAVASCLGAVTLLVTALWSRRVGVNDFSLHALYGNRLVRAYLGASNLHRHAHPFTGFDANDNSVRMADLVKDRGCHRGPYLIVNAAINLVSSRRLAWQKRKAASFTFTPRFCGYEFCDENTTEEASRTHRTGGYARSERYGGEDGVSLGKAMTISGAAASPNMGYHSSPALSFLMTTFNVRLGWWLPNTAMSNSSLLRQRGPRMGLLYLITEALGMTDARKDYVYLSDGGHFENLGLYELIRRRCRLVVACDAEADPELTFSGLGNAIEKCRTDLGVPIDIDVAQIRRDAATGKSRWHCAVGCIRYSEVDGGQHDGALLYIKASLTGDEPQDVATYAQAHEAFPHEPTADQWFDESQFESYRALGERTLMQVLGNATEIARHRGTSGEDFLKRIFLELRKQWYPHSDQGASKPADHDGVLDKLIERLRSDTSLSFLDSQLYPNLQRVADAWFPATSLLQPVPEPGATRLHMPQGPEELRAGFYFCKELIQFMQKVFHDLRLDTQHAAPSNRGWMNLFRRWSLSRMFRFTWTMTAGTYSARFQSFCEYHLMLESGDPSYAHPLHLQATVNPGVPHRDVDIGVHGREGIDWVEEARALELHPYECCLISEFIVAYVNLEKTRQMRATLNFDVYPLKIAVENAHDEANDKEELLNGGLLIVGPHPDNKRDGKAVVYFRIRSSMRNMDLARKAFEEIRRDYRLSGLPVRLGETLPETRPRTFGTALQRRAYREIHMLERDSAERCRWLSQLLREPDSEQDHGHQERA